MADDSHSSCNSYSQRVASVLAAFNAAELHQLISHGLPCSTCPCQLHRIFDTIPALTIAALTRKFQCTCTCSVVKNW
jgi:hypothetical protein